MIVDWIIGIVARRYLISRGASSADAEVLAPKWIAMGYAFVSLLKETKTKLEPAKAVEHVGQLMIAPHTMTPEEKRMFDRDSATGA